MKTRSWEESIAESLAAGGKMHLPNGLPVRCIRFDHNMFECEHGDHPDYKFPVEVQFVGTKPDDLPEWDDSFANQTHALIYIDEAIALTMFECTYELWSHLDGGRNLIGSRQWRLTSEAISRIADELERKVKP